MLAVIVALEVPLALNLNRRAVAELEAQSLAQVQAIASVAGNQQRSSAGLTSFVADSARAVSGRVIVVNAAGVLIADSAGPGLLGTNYATIRRPELLAALRDGVPGSRIDKSETLHEEILATAAPIISGGRRVGAVRITQPTTELRANVRRTLAGVAAIGLGGLTAGLLLAFFIAGSLSRPLRRVADVARRLGGGDLSVRAGDARGSKEITDVARSIDEMATRLERLVRSQREFVGNASHQLRTPLTGLKLRLEAAAGKAPESLRKDIEAAEREADRLGEIIERLLILSRRVEEGQHPDVDLADAAVRAASRWAARAKAEDASLQTVAMTAIVRIDPADLDQMLDNLTENAIRYAPGPITIETGARDDAAFVAVEDRGPGIPEEDREHVMERFYRGRAAPAGGSGLGLAIVRELAERWGGTVAIGDGRKGGTRIEVRFPRGV